MRGVDSLPGLVVIISQEPVQLKSLKIPPKTTIFAKIPDFPPKNGNFNKNVVKKLLLRIYIKKALKSPQKQQFYSLYTKTYKPCLFDLLKRYTMLW